MESTKRETFIKKFLKLYDVVEVKFNNISIDKIYGIAIYDLNDEEEQQEFCWQMTEEEVPSNELLELINVIVNNNFNDGDKITAQPKIIYQSLGWNDYNKFEVIYNQLFEISIDMIDDGELTDSFYMHD